MPIVDLLLKIFPLESVNRLSCVSFFVQAAWGELSSCFACSHFHSLSVHAAAGGKSSLMTYSRGNRSCFQEKQLNDYNINSTYIFTRWIGLAE